MSLRTIIGNLLMKATDAITLPAELAKTNPFNFALDQHRKRPRSGAAEALASLRATFPSLSRAEAELILQQVDLLQRKAGELASQVNRHSLTEQDAKANLQQAFPQIDQDNLASVLMQKLIDTR